MISKDQLEEWKRDMPAMTTITESTAFRLSREVVPALIADIEALSSELAELRHRIEAPAQSIQNFVRSVYPSAKVERRVVDSIVTFQTDSANPRFILSDGNCDSHAWVRAAQNILAYHQRLY